jgi:hypothetical protein
MVKEPAERPLPPVPQLAVASMVLVIAGGIYLVSYLPRRPPLALPAVLLVLAAGTLGANLASLARARQFAWDRFFLVGGWALVAYGVIAGMLEYVFVLDGVTGGPLLLITLTLVLFAIDIPLLFGFSVARYQEPWTESPKGPSL